MHRSSEAGVSGGCLPVTYWDGAQWAPLGQHGGTQRPELRLEHDACGRPVRVYVGDLEVTHLVARVQSNTTMHGTAIEVVLCAGGARRAPVLQTKGADQS